MVWIVSQGSRGTTQDEKKQGNKTQDKRDLKREWLTSACSVRVHRGMGSMALKARGSSSP